MHSNQKHTSNSPFRFSALRKGRIRILLFRAHSLKSLRCWTSPSFDRVWRRLFLTMRMYFVKRQTSKTYVGMNLRSLTTVCPSIPPSFSPMLNAALCLFLPSLAKHYMFCALISFYAAESRLCARNESGDDFNVCRELESICTVV